MREAGIWFDEAVLLYYELEEAKEYLGLGLNCLFSWFDPPFSGLSRYSVQHASHLFLSLFSNEAERNTL